jgi:hypothetical protein
MADQSMALVFHAVAAPPAGAHRVAPRAAAADVVEPRGSSLLPIAGWALIGSSAVIGGIAIYTGVRALDARDEYFASEFTDPSSRDEAAALRTWTNVAWVFAGATAATGAVLLFVHAQQTGVSKTTAAVELRVAPAAAAVRGTF